MAKKKTAATRKQKSSPPKGTRPTMAKTTADGSDEHPYQLSISLNVLEHLGINLYSNVPSVLSEIVANAWDADAETIDISWDEGMKEIVILDDGEGMTEDDVNNRFLTVGYRRRDEQPGVTAKHKRSPMGRKGIGKLSLFSIAGTVKIETVKGREKNALVMRLGDIRSKIEASGGEGTYYPEPADTADIDFNRGTRITLTDLKKKQTMHTANTLRRRLARRFSIIGPSNKFTVTVDGETVEPKDRDYYDKLQYVWKYGEDDVDTLAAAARVFDRNDDLGSDSPPVRGWLGTVKEVKTLKDEEGENLNRIAIFVRGKMAQEDMLDDFSERGVYANYLIGELHFDDLDTYDATDETTKDEDAATSSRQTLVEDDQRYQALKEFVGNELKHVQSKWQTLRTEDGAKKAMEIPAVSQWLEGLGTGTRKKAKTWLGKVNRIRLDEADEFKQLVKHAVLAFEFFNARENIEALDEIDDANLAAVVGIFEELDALESSLYGQIIEQRVEVIQTLRTKVDSNAKEKAVQEYIFDHLWLLDPHWERIEATTKQMEKSVNKLFAGVKAKMTEAQKKGRVDIQYRKTAGKHVIVELKRPGRTVSTAELIEQVTKYRGGMDAILDKMSRSDEGVEIVILLGKEPSDWGTDRERTRSVDSLAAQDARIVFYDQLLEDSERAYQDYLEKRSEVDRLNALIAAIDDYAPTEGD